MADVHIDLNAAGLGDGTSRVNAFTTIASAIAASNADTFIVWPGTYNEIVIVSESGSIFKSGDTEDRAIISGTGKTNDTFKIYTTNVSLYDLVITGSDSLEYNLYLSGASNAKVYNCEISNGGKAIYGNNSALYMESTYIHNHEDSDCIWLRGTTASDFVGCYFDNNSQGVGAPIKISINDGLHVSLNNCTLTGCSSLIEMDTAENILDINNCIIVANGISYNAEGQLQLNNTIVDDASARSTYLDCININNSVTHPAPRDPEDSNYHSTNGNVTITDGISNIAGFTSPKYPASIIFMMDDYINVDDFALMASDLSAKGLVGCFAVETNQVTNWSQLQGFIDAGHEIATQGETGANLTSLDPNFGTEVSGAFSALNTNLTSSSGEWSFVHGNGSGNSNTIAEIKSEGFIGARVSIGNSEARHRYAEGINIFANPGLLVEDQLGLSANGSNIKENIASVIEYISYVGGAWVITGHGFGFFPRNDWVSVFDITQQAVENGTISNVTFTDMIRNLKSEGVESPVDVYTWTPPDNSNINLSNLSESVGVGLKYWESNPRPSGINGEPYPDTKIDIGCNQSTWDSNHPANLP